VDIGDIVDGRYRLLELLGEGAAGKVYRAEDLGQGKPIVALKLLHAKDARWENFFRREFEVLSGLNHPNLVRVYDFGPAPEDDTYYFTQELVVGKPLLDAVAGMRVDQVVGLFIEICRALEFIHAHGVLHRDLKPANIMVNMNNPMGERVRVLDFGLWRELDNTPKKGARWAGTPLYLASEVLRGYGHSVSADLYAVGVTLYQSITRKLPHGRGTPQELLSARKKEPAPDLSHRCSQNFAALVGRLLKEDAKERPESAAEVGAALSAVAPKYALAMPLALGRARLVGRQAEKDLIGGTIKDVNAGRPAPRLIVVEGEPGMGKSRLVQEMKAQVQLDGGRAAVGQCGTDVNWAYRPISEMVRTLAPGNNKEELYDGYRNVMEYFYPDLGSTEASMAILRPVHEEETLQDDIATFFHDMARVQLCVLFVEDIEACDAQSLRVFQKILTKETARHLMIIVTKEPNAQLPSALQDVRDADKFHVRLTPLQKEEMQGMVKALLGVENVPGQLFDTLWAYSKGIPLKVEDYLAALLDKGEIYRGEQGWNFEGVLNRDLPVFSSDEVVQERLRHLTNLEKTVLSALGVFNQPASEKMLSAITGMNRSAVKTSLTRSEAHGILTVVSLQGDTPRFAFRHPSFKDALLGQEEAAGTLPGLHLRCGNVLEERAKEKSDKIAETLAYHFEKAADTGKAVHYLSLATDSSMAMCDVPRALIHARQASRLLRENPNAVAVKESLGAQYRLAKVLFVAGELQECSALLQSIYWVADEEGDHLMAARIQLFRSKLFATLGLSVSDVEPFRQQLEEMGQEGGPVAERLILLAQQNLGLISRPVQVLRETRRLVANERAMSDRDYQLVGWELLTHAAIRARRFRQAVVYAKRRLTVAEKFNSRFHSADAQIVLASALAATGQRLQARDLFKKSLDQADRWGARLLEVKVLFQLARELYVSGAYSDAIARLHEALSLASELSLRIEKLEMFCFLGECLVSLGEYDKAYEQIDAGIKAFGDKSEDPAVALSFLIKADAAMSQNLLKKSDSLLKKATTILKNGREHGHLQARLYKGKGWSYMLKGNFARSRRAFLLAILWYRQTEERFQMARVMVDYGQLLLRNDLPARAYRVVKNAKKIFLYLDAKGEERRLLPLLNAAKGLSNN